MRDIKFRVWDNERNAMLNSKSVDIDFFEGKIEITSDTIRYDEVYTDEIKDFELMQYTGVKDKNGREIYEGDIIKRTDLTPTENHYGKEEVGLVEYKNAQFILRISKDDYYEISSDGLFNFDMADYEVIGNIYENSELLERK